MDPKSGGDHTGYIACEEGFNIHRVADHVKQTGGVCGYDNGKVVDSKEAFFSTPCDFIIPAALVNDCEIKIKIMCM